MSSDGHRAKIPQNYRGRPSLPQSLFWPTRKRNSAQANANNSALAKNPSRKWIFWWAEPTRRLESLSHAKNHQGLEDCEDESDARIFSVPDSEIGRQSSPHIQLELMRRQPQQEDADRVLVENNFDTTSVTWWSKFSAVLLKQFCASAQLKLFSMTQTWTLFKLFYQYWISFVW